MLKISYCFEGNNSIIYDATSKEGKHLKATYTVTTSEHDVNRYGTCTDVHFERLLRGHR